MQLSKAKKFLRHSVRRRHNPEVYIISYPKSGRTWLRALIGYYVAIKYDIDQKYILETEYVTEKSTMKTCSFTHDGSAMKEKRIIGNFLSTKVFTIIMQYYS